MPMRMHIMSDKGLISRMYAEHLHFSSKRNSPLKNSRYIEIYTRQYIQRTGKHMKRWSALLLTRECRECRPNPELVNRTSMKVAIMKNWTIAGFDKDIEKLEILHCSWECTAVQYSLRLLVISQINNFKYRVTIWLSNCTPRYRTKRNVNKCFHIINLESIVLN